MYHCATAWKTLGFEFIVYEGAGGHISGEIILVEHKKHIILTGDLFVNVKGFTEEQAHFNSIAPVLMTSVDTNPKLATKERKELFDLLPKENYIIFGGHGAPKEYKSN